MLVQKPRYPIFVSIADTFNQVVHVAAPLLDNPENTDYDLHFLNPSVEG